MTSRLITGTAAVAVAALAGAGAWQLQRTHSEIVHLRQQEASDRAAIVQIVPDMSKLVAKVKADETVLQIVDSRTAGAGSAANAQATDAAVTAQDLSQIGAVLSHVQSVTECLQSALTSSEAWGTFTC